MQRQATGQGVDLRDQMRGYVCSTVAGIPCNASARVVAAATMVLWSWSFNNWAWYALNMLEMSDLTVSGSAEVGCRRECCVNMRLARWTTSRSPAVSRLRLDMATNQPYVYKVSGPDALCDV